MRYEVDFLVIGSGIAGLSFALKVAPYGKVCILSKGEAAEGSKFCIGHADQAKKPDAKKPDAKEKDDGQCWAVTEAGTRCKHKKDGESDYCKQHAPSVKPSKPLTQCRAMTYEGKQCTRKPEEGKRYCAQHGGK